MICIYHNRDLDGICSAAIVMMYCESMGYPLTLYGWDYGQPLPDILFDETVNDDIVIVDVSFDFGTIGRLAERIHPNKLAWIDHHISAITEYEKFKPALEGVIKTHVQVGKAACELAWEYFFPDKKTPDPVTYLGIYDTWRAKNDPIWEKTILPFQLGMQALCNTPESFPRPLLHQFQDETVINGIIRDGNAIQSYKRSASEIVMNGFSFETVFDGYRAIAVNSTEFSSRIFDSVWDPKKYDIMICFAWNSKLWKISLYSEDPLIDCSVMAKKRGGGGHKGAAGFQSEVLPDFVKQSNI